jgi:tRNA A-37 threonylcarbamoyl transferase component Bud32/tetratricopeptide (TPR) repeat protein
MALSKSDWIKLNQLLDEALDVEPARRPQWVDSLPPDVGNLSTTLRNLLCRQDGPETREVLLPGSALTAGFAALTSGDRVGPYRLIRELGAGGAATVWLAERADGSLHRHVALKLPRVAWLDRGLAARLNRERDILASLEHPSIARLYDAGVDAAGRPFLALEYVEGKPLDRYATDRDLSIEQRLALFLRVARAVAFAHARLIVHRDLKPTNILVKDGGEICLLDFGIARLLHPQSLHDLRLTRVGTLALTPEYAAPEQFTSQPITVGTDVYSLGVLLYWLLSGRSPYELKRDSLAELEEAIVSHDPLPLTKGMTRQLARALRGDIEMIVRKAMSKQPADRYETVNALIEDIERYQRNLPVRAQPQRASYRLRKFVIRNKASVIVAVIVAATLLTGVSVAFWQRQAAQLQAQRAELEAQRAERIKSFIASIFTQAVPKQGEGGVVTASDLLSAANKRVETELGDNVADKSELQAMIGASFLALDEPAKAAPVLRQALKSCDVSAGADEGCKLHAAVLLSDSLLGVRELNEALALLDEHLPQRPTSSAAAEDVVVGWRVRGDILTILNRQQEALASYERATDLATHWLATDHRAALEVLIAKANSFEYFNYTPEHLVAAEQAVHRVTAARGQLRPDVLLTRSERAYGLALVSTGRGVEALPLMRRVLADTRQLDVADTPRVADAEWGLAVVYLNQGILEEAIPLMQHVVQHEERLGTSESLALLERLAWLGMMYSVAAMPDEARRTAERTDRLMAQVQSVSEPIRYRNVLTKAYAAAFSGDDSAAEALIREILSQAGVPALFRLEALALAVTNARLQGDSAGAHQIAMRLVDDPDFGGLPLHHRAAYFSIAATAFLASAQVDEARRALDRASEEYAKARFKPTIKLSAFLNAKAQLSEQSDASLHDDLQGLVDSWRRVNPNSVWHAEAMYWLSRVQQARGESDVAERNRRQAVQLLRNSKFAALRMLVAAQ